MIQANALVLVGHYFQFSLIYILDELFSELFPPHESFILKKKELLSEEIAFSHRISCGGGIGANFFRVFTEALSSQICKFGF